MGGVGLLCCDCWAVLVMTFLCGRSSTGRPDWTCIVLGFTSGSVRFYTEVSPGPLVGNSSDWDT